MEEKIKDHTNGGHALLDKPLLFSYRNRAIKICNHPLSAASTRASSILDKNPLGLFDQAINYFHQADAPNKIYRKER